MMLVFGMTVVGCDKTTDGGDVIVTVTTLAGSGTAGYAEGTGAEAQFDTPRGVAVDDSGNVYVADSSNNCIRKIVVATDEVTTLAGNGTSGSDDGNGDEAKFNLHYGVALDGSGNLYVADTSNQRIRKITPEGVVSTLAGGAIAGPDNGASTAAKFNYPQGIALDSTGNLYVADTTNHRIRMITPERVVTTFAGSTSGYADGTDTEAKFNSPSGVAVDGSGNLYVADSRNYRIRKITPAGEVTTLAGSGASGFADGTGDEAQFNLPYGVALDSTGNDLYVADSGNHRIRKIVVATGVVTTLAGNGANGPADGTGTKARFSSPYGVAVDGSGNIYVADTNNHRIRKITIK
jgi:sugar lactone lactonase YvrE